ncbi:MAG: DUF3794 domain-containing protein [Firmicutes bacterium]|nr:DUF3794 domain-containing protein [Bacillota bacterium]
MSVVDSSVSSASQLYVEREKINTLIHKGETTGQLVLSSETCINAVKIDRIKAKLLEKTVHLFNNKVIIRGIIGKEIFFVDPQNRLRFFQEDLPFSLVVDFPGLKPDGKLEVQTHLLEARVDYILHPARYCLPGLLRQVVVAHFLVVVAEKRQLEVVTKVDLFPRMLSASPVYRKRC